MRKPLQKVILGGSLVGISLLGAGIVSTVMEQNYPDLPVTGQGQISIYNTLPCDVIISSEALNIKKELIPSGGYTNKITQAKDCKDFPYKIRSACFNNSGCFKVCEEENLSYFFKNNSLVSAKDTDEYTKGFARLR